MLQGLNVGGGGGATQEIKVRVRKPGSESTFYPYDFILGTMLHEITHNVHGPHDAAFYKMLDTLTEVWSGYLDAMQPMRPYQPVHVRSHNVFFVSSAQAAMPLSTLLVKSWAIVRSQGWRSLNGKTNQVCNAFDPKICGSTQWPGLKASRLVLQDFWLWSPANKAFSLLEQLIGDEFRYDLFTPHMSRLQGGEGTASKMSLQHCLA